MHHVCWIRNVCIVCIIDLVPRSWIAQLGSRCDPEKRKAIKEKGDTGMVKRTVSKTTNKKTVSSTQFLFSSYVEYLYIYSIVFASIKPWIPALFLLLARSGGPTLKSSAAYTQTFADWVLKQHLKATLVAGSCMVNLFYTYQYGHIHGMESPWYDYVCINIYIHLYTYIVISCRFHTMDMPMNLQYIYIVCLHHMGNKYIEDPLMLNWALDIEHLACLLGVYHIINQS